MLCSHVDTSIESHPNWHLSENITLTGNLILLWKLRESYSFIVVNNFIPKLFTDCLSVPLYIRWYIFTDMTIYYPEGCNCILIAFILHIFLYAVLHSNFCVNKVRVLVWNLPRKLCTLELSNGTLCNLIWHFKFIKRVWIKIFEPGQNTDLKE